MATVPGVLIFGDQMVNGGSPGIAATLNAAGYSLLSEFNDLEVMRITPSDADTGAPTASSLGFYPWYDGTASDDPRQVGSATATTITAATAPGWVSNEHAGKTVTVVNYPTLIGWSNRATVLSNNGDTLTVASWPGGTPAIGSPFWVAQGRFRDYHPVAAWLALAEIGSSYSQRGGSTWPAANLGIGPDAGIVPTLYDEVWSTAPYFHLVKYASVYRMVGQLDTSGSASRANFEAYLAKVAAAFAALASGNTMQWEWLILDQSQQDVLDWVANPLHYFDYEDSLRSFLTYARTTLANPDLKITIVNHDANINAVNSPNGTLLANRVHRTIASESDNTRIADMNGLQLSGANPDNAALNWLENSNRFYYSASTFWTGYARRVVDSYKLMAAGAASTYESALPVYILIGDSIGVGPIDEAYTNALHSPVFTGAPRSSAQLIWNDQSGSGEPYDLADNSNTAGTIIGTGGPDCGMMQALEELHPEGFLLVKMAISGSCLIADGAPYTGIYGGRWAHSISGEAWEDLTSVWDRALAWIHSTGKQADLKGIFAVLGTNDGAVIGGGSLFAAEITTFVADLREHFSTRTSGSDLPIVFRKPQLDYQTAKPDEIVAIRAALETAAENDAHLQLVDVDDLERTTTDNIHETPEASILDGERMVTALQVVAI